MQQPENASLISSCVNERSLAVFTSWLVVYLLIFPVFLSVIYFGCTKWQRRRPSVSHSDVITFHMVAMELLNLVGSCMYFAGFMLQFMKVLNTGLSLKHFSSVGEMCFHCLTCLERYLAAVQPMTYLRLKKRGGVAIRNAGLGCAWLFGATSLALASATNHDAQHFGFAVAVLSIVLVSFCSASVLCVLIRPGPGDRKKMNQTKRAAVHTITAILGALLLRMVAVGFYYVASSESDLVVCIVVLCTFWLAMPSSLVLPLLFLHRERVIPGHRNSLKSKSRIK